MNLPLNPTSDAQKLTESIGLGFVTCCMMLLVAMNLYCHSCDCSLRVSCVGLSGAWCSTQIADVTYAAFRWDCEPILNVIGNW